MAVIAGAALAPARLSAQGTEPARSHLVRVGDTLWRIAQDSLGDARRWREILDLNVAIVRAADALPVGVTLRLPATTGGSQAQPPAPRPVDEPPVAAPPPPAAGAVGPPPDTLRRTIFFGAKPAGGFVIDSSGVPPAASPAVPAATYESITAPFVIEQAELDRAARCVSVGSGDERPNAGVLLAGQLSFRLPGGTTAAEGSRWVLVRRETVLDGLGVVGIPTGLVRVSAPATAAEPATADVVAQFDAIACTDAILPAPPPAVPSGRATPITNGATGRVVWIVGESLLPTLQHALIVDIGRAAGIQAGDGITIMAGDGSTVVARATVVRADARTATALVTQQSLGSLAVGLAARVTEKLP